MVDIRDFVGETDDPSFQRGRHPLGLMVLDAVPHLQCQIQPHAALFQHIYGADALVAVTVPVRAHLVQCPLPCMAERRMAKVMAKGNGFHQVFVHPKGFGNGPCVLGNFQGMSQPCPVVIPLWG